MRCVNIQCRRARKLRGRSTERLCFSVLYLDRRLIPGTFGERLSIKVARFLGLAGKEEFSSLWFRRDGEITRNGYEYRVESMG